MNLDENDLLYSNTFCASSYGRKVEFQQPFRKLRYLMPTNLLYSYARFQEAFQAQDILRCHKMNEQSRLL